MSSSNRPAVGRRRLRRGAVLLALTCVMLTAGMMTTASSASAQALEPFCFGAWVAPLNQGGDRCFSGGHWLTSVIANSYDHSICVNGWQNGGPMTNWNCTSGPGGAFAGVTMDGSRFGNGVIRNNTSGDWTEIYSGYAGYPG